MSSNTVSSETPVRQTPFPSLPPRYDGRELEFLKAALDSNSLFYTRANGYVAGMLKKARETFGGKYAVAVSSGTAAVHVAIGAAGVEAGAEVITTPITDMGTLIGVLYQNAVPVFADVDARTYNLTAKTVEAAITPRTQAVIAVHLAGSPCEIEAIAAVCKSRGIALIEDNAQAFGATVNGQHVGNFGDLACFSFNEFKHLSCGDGGVVITNNEALYTNAHNFADKCYDRLGNGNRLTTLCPNYRMSELQGAVALAQLDRLDQIVQRRRTLGDWLTNALSGIDGVLPPVVLPGAASSYWFYMIRVDEQLLGISRDEFSKQLNEEGIPAAAGYIARPLYEEPVFQNRSFFAGGVWPAEQIAGKSYDYRHTRCPNADLVLRSSIRLTLHEGFSQNDVEDYVRAIRKVALRARR
jgi:dTDP-4-amino-4,6-dideoxygalactose transaminase